MLDDVVDVVVTVVVFVDVVVNVVVFVEIDFPSCFEFQKYCAIHSLRIGQKV